MKKINNVILLVLLLILALSSVTCGEGVAMHADKADILNDYGLFKGTEKGYELEKPSTRAESAAMIVRLLGAEEEAFKSQYNHPFNDVPEWANPYVGYMYENGLTTGISKTTYGSSQIVDGKSYMTFILRVLGYSDQEGDFRWSEALEFSNKIGILSDKELNSVKSGNFNRDGMVLLTYNSLNINFKEREDTILTKIKNELKEDSIEATVTVLLEKDEDVDTTFFILGPDNNLNVENIKNFTFTGYSSKLSEDEFYRKLVVLDHEKRHMEEEYRDDFNSFSKNLFGINLKEDEHIMFISGKIYTNNLLKIYNDDVSIQYFAEIDSNLEEGKHKIPLIEVKDKIYTRVLATKEEMLSYIESYIDKISIVPKKAISLVKHDGETYFKINRDLLSEEIKDFTHASNLRLAYNKYMDLNSEQGIRNQLKTRLKITSHRRDGSFSIYSEVGEDSLIRAEDKGVNNVLLFSEDGQPIGFFAAPGYSIQ